MVKALQQGGHEVKYLSQFANPQAEYYGATSPSVIGYSSLFKKIIQQINKSNFHTHKRFGWPPLNKISSEIEAFDPDVLIVRDYGIPQMVAAVISMYHGASVIVQEQRPKYKPELNRPKLMIDMLYKIIYDIPLQRMTPVLGNPQTGVTTKNVHYVPFPIDPDMYPSHDDISYFNNNIINIISVGTLTSQRKRHIMLLRAFNKLTAEHDIRLTIAGHLDDPSDAHYQRITEYIDEHDLHSKVDIQANLSYKELQQTYIDHDLFILPSEREPAAVSPVEAMAAGLPVICSDENGTSDYIDQGKNGYVFESGSQSDLISKTSCIISSRENIRTMSRAALSRIDRYHSPLAYCNKVENILHNSHT